MRLIFYSFVFLKINFSLAQCDWINVVPVEEFVCPTGNWILSFEDNFDQQALDQTTWKIPYQGVLRGFSFENEKQWYANTGGNPSIPIENNIVVNNGTLKLITRNEVVEGQYIDWELEPPAMNSNSFNYTSGNIESQYKFGYGTYETRCKVPKGKGFWPAFWLYNGYKNAEIDVFEFWNESSFQVVGGELYNTYDPSKLAKVVNTNMHYTYINGSVTTTMCPLKIGDGTDYSTDFHTFTLEWDHFKIKWYIDGVLVRAKYRYYTLNGQEVDCNSIETWHEYAMLTNFPNPENYSVTFNTAISVSGGLPDSDTPFPSTFEIDYFRYWKKDNCSGNLIANTISDLDISQDKYNIKIKEYIFIGSNVILAENQQLALKASDAIDIDPGSQLLGTFEAWVAPCNVYKSSSEDNNINFDQHIESEVLSNFLIPESQNSQNVKIKPNPFNSNIQLEFSNENSYQLTISNSTGVTILKPRLINTKVYELDLSEFSSGIYFVKLIDLISLTPQIHKIIKL